MAEEGYQSLAESVGFLLAFAHIVKHDGEDDESVQDFNVVCDVRCQHDQNETTNGRENLTSCFHFTFLQKECWDEISY